MADDTRGEERVTLQEGPAFGALIIGAGLAFLVWSKTQNIMYGVAAGIAVALADYFLLTWISSFKKK